MPHSGVRGHLWAAKAGSPDPVADGGSLKGDRPRVKAYTLVGDESEQRSEP